MIVLQSKLPHGHKRLLHTDIVTFLLLCYRVDHVQACCTKSVSRSWGSEVILSTCEPKLLAEVLQPTGECYLTFVQRGV